MVETMAAWGVGFVFGMVGHSNLGLAEAIRRQEALGKLTYIGIRHEGAASFAASAYGKLTGRPAACFSIAGPGATNMLTGLSDAHVDRAPVLALTGQVDTQVLGPGAFQEVDLQAAYGKVARWSQTVLQGSRHAELVNLALTSAILERGVSHLVFPDEVQVQAAGEAEPSGPEGRLTRREIAPPSSSLDQAVSLLRRSQRPVIIVGHGARFHMDAVLSLAETMNAPVVTTFKGKGLIADSHPLGCGVLGRSGTPIASCFMNESDCLLVFGASFSNHTGITSKKPTIQVDFDPMILGKFHAVDVPLWGEIGVTASLLRDAAKGEEFLDQRKEVAERWSIWRTEKVRREADESGKGLASAVVFAALNRLVPDDAIIPVDVGNNTYSFGRYFECEQQSVLMSGKGLASAVVFAALNRLVPDDAIMILTGRRRLATTCGPTSFGRYFECEQQSVLMSGYLGSIGFAFPAALGAWAATTEKGSRFEGRKVVSISGDGGFGQYMAELTTAVKYGMNITHVLLNNHELGKISKEQRAGNWDVWETSLTNPNFADYASLCGALGARVTRREKLPDSLEEALRHDGPALVEILTDPLLV